MASGGIPTSPRVLQDLVLAKRARGVLGAAGEPVDLWEAYSLAQADSAALTEELARISDAGSAGSALQGRLGELRRNQGTLAEDLRQALPLSVPLFADAAAL